MDLISTTQNGEDQVISFQGTCTIENAAEIKQILSDELFTAKQVIFDLTSVIEADISFFQLLVAALHTCKRHNMLARCKGIPAPVAQLAENAGFAPTETFLA